MPVGAGPSKARDLAHCGVRRNDHILRAMPDPKTPAIPSADGRSSSGEIEQFLGAARQVTPLTASTPRLVFALDATMSRQPTWDMASQVQAGMFDEAAAVGGLAVQLVYFRGFGECKASRWVADPRALRDLMSRIQCQSGATQIGRVLDHVRREAGREPVKALVYVGDAIEESMDELCFSAGKLGLLGVKAFLFHEGGNPTVAAGFAELARLTGGAAMAFDARAPASLAALLRAVATYAAGGAPALSRLAASNTEARRLIAAMPAAVGR